MIVARDRAPQGTRLTMKPGTPDKRRMQRIFSGIQPSGIPHLGNYLGAIRNWVALQEAHDCLFCLVDLHAITAPQEPDALRAQTRIQAAVLLAAGIDPARHILFNQSAVSAHARLAWIFNCVARIGWLNRMTQFKDKAGDDRENASAGLYVYPDLMAADILAYHATRVPVGDDQRQHLELTRDIAAKFNHDYGVAFFPLVEALVPPEAARVMSLRDGSRKMSKSDASEQSRITLIDQPDAIALKIRRARTDPEALPSEPAGLAGRPEARNLVEIYAALTGATLSAVLVEHGGRGFGPFKEALTGVVTAAIAPIATETTRLLGDPGELDRTLRDGAARARAIAEPIVLEAERIVGFLK